MKPHPHPCRPAPARITLLALLALALLALTACAECEDDYDCPAARVCDPESATCQSLVCRADRDCPPAHTCADNACVQTPPAPAPDAPDAIVIGPG